MKHFIWLLLLIPFASFAGDRSADSTWLVTHYTKREVYIPMRDGTRLFTAIYEPVSRSGKHPFLLSRTPYSIGPYGADFKAFWNSHYMNYFREHYIIVLQDVRGRYMSEGMFEDIRPFNPRKHGTETDEASDTWDTIDWLLKNVKNNNRRVGVWGISYPGFYATEAALCGHPAIKAVSPQAPVTEWFLGDDFHHNGAFMEMDAFGFYSGFGRPRHGLTTKGSGGFQYYTPDKYKFYLETGSLKSLAALLGDSISFMNDLYQHPNYDQWWQVRNTRSWVQYIKPHIATMVVGGLFDAEDCYGAWNLYKAIEKKARNKNILVVGPWSHGGWARTTGEYLGNIRFGHGNSEWYQRHIEQPFFDHYLLGKGDLNRISPANIFFSGANKWRRFSQWPPADTRSVSLFLNGDGKLSFKENPGSVHVDYVEYRTYTSDPAKPVPYADGVQTHRTAEYMDDDQRFAACRPDVLVYQSDTLTHDVTLAGPVITDLFTSISTTDADFVVKLIDVFPDDFAYNDSTDGKGNGKNYTMGGYQMLVRGEVMRGRYRNSFEDPQPFKPGQVTEVKYTMPDVAHVFKKGHRIMVQVQSTWFPLVDRNPQKFVDIYKCDESDFQSCDITIYSTPQHHSRIILPVLY